ncbi:hypothetical protein PAEPH01_1818 [Pancytospora epiphaga]|nr:hypothetical protein PAEPH01_1818 [Pancytospora epiphaga]
MNKARMNSLKRVLDNALKCLFRCSNFCRLRAYEEFDLLSLYVSAILGKAQAIKKWTLFRCIIRDLILNPFRFRKLSWAKESRRWLKVMKIDLSELSHLIKSNIISSRMASLKKRDFAFVCVWAAVHRIGSGKRIKKLQIVESRFTSCVSALTCIKTGSFPFTNILVYYMVIPIIFKNRCVACDGTFPKDVTHLLLLCPTYWDLRA